MNNAFKIVLAGLGLIILSLGCWSLALVYGPQTAIEDVLPEQALVFGDLKDPLDYWQKFERSDLWKSISSIDAPSVLKRNKVPAKYIDQIVKGYQEVGALIKNPVVGQLLGKEVAVAVYSTGTPKSGILLITRPRASIQAAENLSIFMKEWGQEIEVKKENVDGQAVVHLFFKEKKK